MLGEGRANLSASCKSALTPPPTSPPLHTHTHTGGVVYSTDRPKAVVPLLVLLFVALCFILRGDSFYILTCVILFVSFSVLLDCDYLGKGELILVLFVRVFDLRLFVVYSTRRFVL